MTFTIPIALDPNATYEFTLPEWECIPADSRPTFVAKHATARQASEMRRQLADSMTTEDPISVWVEIVSKTLVNWYGFYRSDGSVIPFSKDAIATTLTEDQIANLLARMQQAAALDREQRKNFEQPSRCSAAALNGVSPEIVRATVQ